ncbi:Luc7-like protein 3 [Strongyloides ratti]|uniref:Luc7-like protein 3 n=1 Tax=Strongyloides ratti TaxID=34506 RepID=A0A090MZA2_STRRB|nr:Luc7-like protein 3 [Strongyloides ratti]CEF68579.1 Luc7-like protein 3 [Strongyloides ratti]
MTATEQMAAVLNELMGTRRNADIGTNISARFDDPEICKYFLVDYCPHDLFINTKSDLGPCSYIHDESLREQYRRSSRYCKLGYERSLYNTLSRLKEDMAKKIAKNKERLAITQSKDETKKYEQRSDIERKINKIKIEIEENQKQAESYGLQGEIEKAAEITTIVERLVEEKKTLEKRIEAMLAPTDEMGNKQKQMEVCEICSCFLVVGDAETRMEEHFQGKQHMGYAKINETLDELKKKYGDILYSDRNDRRERRDRDYDRRRTDKKDYDRRNRDYTKDYYKRHDRGHGRERGDYDYRRDDRYSRKRSRSRSNSRN